MRVYLIIAALILSSIIIHNVSETAEAVGVPVVTIAFLEGMEEQVAEVAPGEDGIVRYPGTVFATLPAGEAVQDVVVDLRGTSENGWPVTITPEQVTVSPGDMAYFTATVTAPPEASPSISDELTVSGTAHAEPGFLLVNVVPVKGITRIQQFYRLGLEGDKSEKTTTPRGQAALDLTIFNYGNGGDNFSLAVKNIEQELKGFQSRDLFILH